MKILSAVMIILASLVVHGHVLDHDVSENEAAEIAKSYIQNVDSGFLATHIAQGSTPKVNVIELSHLNPDIYPMPFYTVIFEIPDYKQELLFKFWVCIQMHNGQIVPPASENFSWRTSREWEGNSVPCFFHPDGPGCDWETPI